MIRARTKGGWCGSPSRVLSVQAAEKEFAGWSSRSFVRIALQLVESANLSVDPFRDEVCGEELAFAIFIRLDLLRCAWQSLQRDMQVRQASIQ